MAEPLQSLPQPLPSLQQLRLHSITVSDTDALMQQLSQRTTVTLLELGSLQKPDWHCKNPPSALPLVSGLLSSMSRLQDLSIKHMQLEHDSLTALSSSSLTSLQLIGTAHFTYPDSDDPEDLQNFYDPTRDRTAPPCLPKGPWLSQLAQLRVLHVFDNGIDASVLAHMPQLQTLIIWECILHPEHLQNDEDPDPEEILLAALAQLQHLRHLQLCNNRVWSERSLQPGLYTDLTASSQLTQLRIQVKGSPPLELGSAQYVFPAGRQLQHLQELWLENGPDDDGTLWCGDDAYCLDTADLGRLVNACPALTSLRLFNVVQPGSDLSPLIDLPASCVSLIVAGGAFDDDSAAKVLCRLTQLQCLDWDEAESVTEAGLVQLTALKALTLLKVNEWPESRWPSEFRREELDGSRPTPFPFLSLSEIVSPGESYRPVWLQLRDVCDNNPEVAMQRLKQVDEENSRLQQRVAELEELCARVHGLLGQAVVH